MRFSAKVAVGIGLAALVALLALARLLSTGSGDDESREANGCRDSNRSLPVMAARLTSDGRTVRMAYSGPAEPCLFAAASSRGTWFVELRTQAAGADLKPDPKSAICAEAELPRQADPETRVVPVNGRGDLLTAEQIDEILAPDVDCGHVPRGQPAFVID